MGGSKVFSPPPPLHIYSAGLFPVSTLLFKCHSADRYVIYTRKIDKIGIICVPYLVKFHPELDKSVIQHRGLVDEYISLGIQLRCKVHPKPVYPVVAEFVFSLIQERIFPILLDAVAISSAETH